MLTIQHYLTFNLHSVVTLCPFSAVCLPCKPFSMFLFFFFLPKEFASVFVIFHYFLQLIMLNQILPSKISITLLFNVIHVTGSSSKRKYCMCRTQVFLSPWQWTDAKLSLLSGLIDFTVISLRTYFHTLLLTVSYGIVTCQDRKSMQVFPHYTLNYSCHHGRISDWPVVICNCVMISVILLWLFSFNFRLLCAQPSSGSFGKWQPRKQSPSYCERRLGSQPPEEPEY